MRAEYEKDVFDLLSFGIESGSQKKLERVNNLKCILRLCVGCCNIGCGNSFCLNFEAVRALFGELQTGGEKSHLLGFRFCRRGLFL